MGWLAMGGRGFFREKEFGGEKVHFSLCFRFFFFLLCFYFAGHLVLLPGVAGQSGCGGGVAGRVVAYSLASR